MVSNTDNSYLNNITVLNRPNCKIKNRERVNELLAIIITSGANQLQVITDFDYTITKQKSEGGKPLLSSFGIFKQSKSLPAEYVRESKKLYEKYRPIEINPHMLIDEKAKYMLEWYSTAAQLLK